MVEGWRAKFMIFSAQYMEQELGADEMGQYFSSCISRLMAGYSCPALRRR
jgi:hypothetical protein